MDKKKILRIFLVSLLCLPFGANAEDNAKEIAQLQQKVDQDMEQLKADKDKIQQDLLQLREDRLKLMKLKQGSGRPDLPMLKQQIEQQQKQNMPNPNP